MNHVRIRTIELSGFRGVWPTKKPVVLDCGEGGKSLIVFAENALGKSTFADAVEFILAQRLRKEDYWPEEFKPRHRVNVFLAECPDVEHATVTLTFTDGAATWPCSVDLNHAGEMVAARYHAAVKGLVRSMDAGACILDHDGFTRFVNETLRGRGDRFSQLLGLEEIALFRDGLDVLARGIREDLAVQDDTGRCSKLATECEDLAVKIRGAASALNLHIEDVTSSRLSETLKDCCPQTAIQAQVADVDLLAACERVDWDKLTQALAVRGPVEAALLRRQKLNEKIGAAEQVEPQDMSLLKGLVVQSEGLLRQETEFWREVLDKLYQAGLVIIDDALLPDEVRRDLCPLCDQPMSWEALRGELAAKRERFAAIRLAHQGLQRQWGQVTLRLGPRFEAWAKVFPAEEIAELNQAKESVESNISSLASLSKADLKALQQAAESLNDGLAERKAALEKARDAIDVSDPNALARETVANVRVIAQAWGRKARVEQELANVNSLLQAKETWCQCLDKEAKQFAREENALNVALIERLNNVGEDKSEGLIQRYYRILHPYDDVIPFVEVVGRVDRSLRLKCRFKGKEDQAAVGVLSDSHRGSYGLSMFLAAFKFRSLRGGEGFIVLDDVTYGLDPGHRRTLLGLLQEELNDVQVILLTHDELLYEMGQQLLDRATFKFVRIPYWHERGVPVVEEETDFYAKARDFADHGEKQCAALYARLGFERALKKVCADHHIPVPYVSHPRRCTCEDLLKALNSALAEDSIVELEAYKKQVKYGRTLANLAVHYSDFLQSPLVTADIQGVIDTFERFESLFKCRKCGSWYRNLQPGWKCPCGTDY